MTDLVKRMVYKYCAFSCTTVSISMLITIYSKSVNSNDSFFFLGSCFCYHRLLNIVTRAESLTSEKRRSTQVKCSLTTQNSPTAVGFG